MTLLDTLTQDLFDYAGMFPPASLGFTDALEQAAEHPKTLRRPGLVGIDMVLKPEHLSLLTDEAMENAGWNQGTCTIALVGFDISQAEEHTKRVQAFNQEHADKKTIRKIVSLEGVTKSDTPQGLNAARETLVAMRDTLKDDAHVYLEPRWSKEQWNASGDTLFTLLGRLPQRHQVGVKVRCAGETRLDRETLVDVIQQVSRNEIPLKATQGLHHPIIERRWGNDRGFLNLIAALRLADTHHGDIPRDRLRELLVEKDPRAFSFDDGLRWNDHETDPHGLQVSMQRVPLSIGSCSIREPDDDLTRLFP